MLSPLSNILPEKSEEETTFQSFLNSRISVMEVGNNEKDKPKVFLLFFFTLTSSASSKTKFIYSSKPWGKYTQSHHTKLKKFRRDVTNWKLSFYEYNLVWGCRKCNKKKTNPIELKIPI